MGYYASIESSTFVLPAENLDEAYTRMCKLNDNNNLKRGGSWPRPDNIVGPHEKIWFSWMDWNYPETCKDAQEILEQLGFETFIGEDNGNLYIVSYDSKTGSEDDFLNSISDICSGEIEWREEDGKMWKNIFGNKEMKTVKGKIVYEQ